MQQSKAAAKAAKERKGSVKLEPGAKKKPVRGKSKGPGDTAWEARMQTTGDWRKQAAAGGAEEKPGSRFLQIYQVTGKGKTPSAKMAKYRQVAKKLSGDGSPSHTPKIKTKSSRKSLKGITRRSSEGLKTARKGVARQEEDEGFQQGGWDGVLAREPSVASEAGEEGSGGGVLRNAWALRVGRLLEVEEGPLSARAEPTEELLTPREGQFQKQASEMNPYKAEIMRHHRTTTQTKRVPMEVKLIDELQEQFKRRGKSGYGSLEPNKHSEKPISPYAEMSRQPYKKFSAGTVTSSLTSTLWDSVKDVRDRSKRTPPSPSRPVDERFLPFIKETRSLQKVILPDTKPDAEPAVKDKFQKFQNRLIALLKRQDLPRFPKPTEELATAAKQASDAVAAALEAMRLQTERAVAGALDIEELSKARSRGVLSGRQDAMSAKVQSLHDQLKALRAQLDQAEGEKIQIKVTEALRGEPSRSPSPPPGRQVYARRNMATIALTETMRTQSFDEQGLDAIQQSPDLKGIQEKMRELQEERKELRQRLNRAKDRLQQSEAKNKNLKSKIKKLGGDADESAPVVPRLEELRKIGSGQCTPGSNSARGAEERDTFGLRGGEVENLLRENAELQAKVSLLRAETRKEPKVTHHDLKFQIRFMSLLELVRRFLSSLRKVQKSLDSEQLPAQKEKLERDKTELENYLKKHYKYLDKKRRHQVEQLQKELETRPALLKQATVSTAFPSQKSVSRVVQLAREHSADEARVKTMESMEDESSELVQQGTPEPKDFVELAQEEWLARHGESLRNGPFRRGPGSVGSSFGSFSARGEDPAQNISVLSGMRVEGGDRKAGVKKDLDSLLKQVGQSQALIERVEKKNEELLGESELLKGENAQLREEVQEAEAKWRSRFNQLETTVNAKSKKLAELERSVRSATLKTNNVYKKKVREHEAQILSLTESLKQSTDTLQKMNDEMLKMKTEKLVLVKKLQEGGASEKEALKAAHQELSRNTEQKTNLQTQLTSLESVIGLLKGELEDERKSRADQLNQAKERLETIERDGEEHLLKFSKEHKKKQEGLRAELALAEDAKKGAQKEARDHKEQASRLQGELAQLKEQIEVLAQAEESAKRAEAEAKKEVQAEKMRAGAAVEEVERRRATAEKQAKRAEEALQMKEAELEGLARAKEAEFDKAAEAFKAQELLKLRKETQRLRDEMGEEEARRKKEEDNSARLVGELEREKKQKTKELKEQREEMDKRMGDLEKLLAVAQEREAAGKQKLEEKERAHGELAERLAKEADRRRKTQEELRNKQAELETMETEKYEVHDNLQQLEKGAKENSEALLEKDREIERLEAKAATASKEHAREVDAREQIIAQLRQDNQNEKLQAERDSLASRVDALRTQITQKEKLIEDGVQERARLEKVAKGGRKAKQMKRGWLRAHENYKMLREDFSQTLNCLKNVATEQMTAYECEAEESHKQYEGVRKELAEVLAEKQELAESVNALQREVEVLTYKAKTQEINVSQRMGELEDQLEAANKERDAAIRKSAQSSPTSQDQSRSQGRSSPSPAVLKKRSSIFKTSPERRSTIHSPPLEEQKSMESPRPFGIRLTEVERPLSPPQRSPRRSPEQQLQQRTPPTGGSDGEEARRFQVYKKESEQEKERLAAQVRQLRGELEQRTEELAVKLRGKKGRIGELEESVKLISEAVRNHAQTVETLTPLTENETKDLKAPDDNQTIQDVLQFAEMRVQRFVALYKEPFEGIRKKQRMQRAGIEETQELRDALTRCQNKNKMLEMEIDELDARNRSIKREKERAEEALTKSELDHKKHLEAAQKRAEKFKELSKEQQMQISELQNKVKAMGEDMESHEMRIGVLKHELKQVESPEEKNRMIRELKRENSRLASEIQSFKRSYTEDTIPLGAKNGTLRTPRKCDTDLVLSKVSSSEIKLLQKLEKDEVWLLLEVLTTDLGKEQLPGFLLLREEDLPGKHYHLLSARVAKKTFPRVKDTERLSPLKVKSRLRDLREEKLNLVEQMRKPVRLTADVNDLRNELSRAKLQRNTWEIEYLEQTQHLQKLSDFVEELNEPGAAQRYLKEIKTNEGQITGLRRDNATLRDRVIELENQIRTKEREMAREGVTAGRPTEQYSFLDRTFSDADAEMIIYEFDQLERRQGGAVSPIMTQREEGLKERVGKLEALLSEKEEALTLVARKVQHGDNDAELDRNTRSLFYKFITRCPEFDKERERLLENIYRSLGYKKSDIEDIQESRGIKTRSWNSKKNLLSIYGMKTK